ncbi:6-N-hydroxylaminopurine resistance protein [Novipirellula galeiformis]|uniref:6-N-hydroxylaminopurine resistance protein n=1 Tax=Novipirellula galeiformis TaxID=2528004 RepID=A0A5C6CF30_9BACT|nr:MOSC domain-containing protein [Novipirellula galeiformis]TWU22031.1 6-N-hydroxylaminopurine resistance protein [Novipirellula galeiformis]
MNANLLSINVGLPRTLGDAKPWTSGFLKESVTEPLWLGTTNLEGDGQADRVHHGGPHKAVCVYAAAHYPEWRRTLQKPDLIWGDFGENFTVENLIETEVCIGDTWNVGSATVQVSQPRQPCWKLARRWQIKDLALQVQQSGRTGWYFRVLVEGLVQRAMPLTLVERSHPEWTIAEANRIMHHDKHDRDAAARLAALPTLSPSWKTTLTNRVEKHVEPDADMRLEGESRSS